jgi:predicted amidophosphoribosyltransferase
VRTGSRPAPWGAAARWLAAAGADLADLVLPTACAGCGAAGTPTSYGVCPACVAVLERLVPTPTQPTPTPPGFPPTASLGGYDGVLRAALLAYKEKGRHRLAAPLGGLLAEVVAAAVGPARPVLLIPVPSTARAARARQGDHLLRLARHAAARLRRAGWPVATARVLRAVPRPDSAALGSVARAEAAADAFRVRTRRLPAAPGAVVVVLDDVVTTGATLTAVADRLARAGVPVTAAAVLAATRRRRPETAASGRFPTLRDA